MRAQTAVVPDLSSPLATYKKRQGQVQGHCHGQKPSQLNAHNYFLEGWQYINKTTETFLRSNIHFNCQLMICQNHPGRLN